jgi:hypothetical protein
MASHPEINVYPVELYPTPEGEHSPGDWTRAQRNPRPGNRRSWDVERYLRGLVGKSVRVHTSGAGQLRGVLEAILSDAIILRTDRGQVLIHDWAIETIEGE